MKKYFFILLMVMMAIGANAQTTWNVRVGGGMGLNASGDISPASAFMLQANIPFERTSKFIVSPTLNTSFIFGDFSADIMLPVYFGYK